MELFIIEFCEVTSKSFRFKFPIFETNLQNNANTNKFEPTTFPMQCRIWLTNLIGSKEREIEKHQVSSKKAAVKDLVSEFFYF